MVVVLACTRRRYSVDQYHEIVHVNGRACNQQDKTMADTKPSNTLLSGQRFMRNNSDSVPLERASCARQRLAAGHEILPIGWKGATVCCVCTHDSLVLNEGLMLQLE